MTLASTLQFSIYLFIPISLPLGLEPYLPPSLLTFTIVFFPLSSSGFILTTPSYFPSLFSPPPPLSTSQRPASPNSWVCVSSTVRRRHHITWQVGRLTLSCTSWDSRCSPANPPTMAGHETSAILITEMMCFNPTNSIQMWKAVMIYCMCVPVLVYMYMGLCVHVVQLPNCLYFLWEIFHNCPIRTKIWVNSYSKDVGLSHEEQNQKGGCP